MSESRTYSYADVVADEGQHYRLPHWLPGSSVACFSDGFRAYLDGKYVGYIGSLGMGARELTTFQKVEKLGRSRMMLCPICGNKRCPKAEDALMKCSGSNAVGQVGDWDCGIAP